METKQRHAMRITVSRQNKRMDKGLCLIDRGRCKKSVSEISRVTARLAHSEVRYLNVLSALMATYRSSGKLCHVQSNV